MIMDKNCGKYLNLNLIYNYIFSLIFELEAYETDFNDFFIYVFKDSILMNLNDKGAKLHKNSRVHKKSFAGVLQTSLGQLNTSNAREAKS